MKNTIKVERARLNITQAELAAKTQVSRQTINAIEAGKYVPSATLALKMSRLFGRTVNDIFELEAGD